MVTPLGQMWQVPVVRAVVPWSSQEAAIFPKSFSTVAIVVGLIWIIQGLGIADTGSFMDRRPAWAIAGMVLTLAGVVSALARRRRQREPGRNQPGS